MFGCRLDVMGQSIHGHGRRHRVKVNRMHDDMRLGGEQHALHDRLRFGIYQRAGKENSWLGKVVDSEDVISARPPYVVKSYIAVNYSLS